MVIMVHSISQLMKQRLRISEGHMPVSRGALPRALGGGLLGVQA